MGVVLFLCCVVVVWGVIEDLRRTGDEVRRGVLVHARGEGRGVGDGLLLGEEAEGVGRRLLQLLEDVRLGARAPVRLVVGVGRGWDGWMDGWMGGWMDGWRPRQQTSDLSLRDTVLLQKPQTPRPKKHSPDDVRVGK